MTAGVASILRKMIGSFCAKIKEKGIKERRSIDKNFIRKEIC
jgi:hypothetical protein